MAAVQPAALPITGSAELQELLAMSRAMAKHMKIIDVTTAAVFRMLLQRPGPPNLQALMRELGVPDPQ